MCEKDAEGVIPQRVTTRTIAAELGIHFTTVAEALRGSPRVKESTRKKVEATALRMGYRPDPMLSALNSYRTSQKKPGYQGTLAWLNGFDDPNYFINPDHVYHYGSYVGAKERVRDFGYELDTIWMRDSGMSQARATAILKNRNVSGILLAPQPEGRVLENFSWKSFSTVRIGYSANRLPFATVGPNQFLNTQKAYQSAWDYGWRRIAFACPQWLDYRVNCGFSGGYLAARQRLGGDEIPLFMDESYDGDAESFLAWYAKWKPEVLLFAPKDVYYEFLNDADISIPEELGVVWLSLGHTAKEYSGIDECGEQVGAAAAEVLVAMIRRFARGFAPVERITEISGRWIKGKTLRKNPRLNKRRILSE